jgi:hypothetical protein
MPSGLSGSSIGLPSLPPEGSPPASTLVLPPAAGLSGAPAAPPLLLLAE